jgi:hypothetical protein
VRRIRQGIWIRDMSEEEYDMYVANCDMLNKPCRSQDGKTVTEPEASNVVPLRGDRVGVPESGASGEDGDHRKRYRMKYAGRLGKRWSEIVQSVQNGEYTWDDFVASLTPEELARGQLMDKNGGFAGRPPSYVPRQFHDACVRELLGRGRVLYKENYVKAIQAMTEIASSKSAKEADRIKAATFVIERLEGKVPDKLEISAADPWQQIISGIVSEVDEDAIASAQQYLNRMNQDQP